MAFPKEILVSAHRESTHERPGGQPRIRRISISFTNQESIIILTHTGVRVSQVPRQPALRSFPRLSLLLS